MATDITRLQQPTQQFLSQAKFDPGKEGVKQLEGIKEGPQQLQAAQEMAQQAQQGGGAGDAGGASAGGGCGAGGCGSCGGASAGAGSEGCGGGCGGKCGGCCNQGQQCLGGNCCPPAPPSGNSKNIAINGDNNVVIDGANLSAEQMEQIFKNRGQNGAQSSPDVKPVEGVNEASKIGGSQSAGIGERIGKGFDSAVSSISSSFGGGSKTKSATSATKSTATKTSAPKPVSAPKPQVSKPVAK